MLKRKGFTLIELIVVMAIIGILILLGQPKYKEYTRDARLTRLMVETKELEKASQKYYMSNNDWPRLTDDAYTSEEVISLSERILDSTGKVVELDIEGNYYDIDYSNLSNYITKPSNPENYVLQNPVGRVYGLDKPTEVAKARIERGLNIEVPLYDFATATFTNAGTTGRYGPTQVQLNNAYNGSILEDMVTSSNGIQLWTVPKTGLYRIETYGAQGGNKIHDNAQGGLGAIMKGEFRLIKGHQLKILVGQEGVVGGGSGGGGGTFVVTKENEPLIISGGGGGRWNYQINASTTINATYGSASNGGASNGFSSGGGGFYTNGIYIDKHQGYDTEGGYSFINGGLGGYGHGGKDNSSARGNGGFGGGGGGNAGGHSGGGGGYSGGNGGVSGGDGSGGGSYNSGTNQSNTVGNTGHGKVIITYIGE